MDFSVENVEVYSLEKAIIQSGYPKSVDIDSVEVDYKRGKVLGNAKSGSGHDCYLKGIMVSMDIVAPQYWWQQFQRYHFADIVSSQSKMHKLLEMDIEKQSNDYVDVRVFPIIADLVSAYNFNIKNGNKERAKEVFQMIVSTCPMGLMLRAGVVTNYLQLKTMYLQRKGHKLEEWQEFCRVVRGLPQFVELTGVDR